MMRSIVFLFLAIALTNPLQAQEVDWRHLDERLSFEERTNILVAQLSTEEKIAQLVHEASSLYGLENNLIVSKILELAKRSAAEGRTIKWNEG